jgi:hypothetical protein
MNNLEPKSTDDIGTRLGLGAVDLLSQLAQIKALQEGGLKQYAKLMRYDIGEKDKGETNE